jgi:hypothetical protein
LRLGCAGGADERDRAQHTQGQFHVRHDKHASKSSRDRQNTPLRPSLTHQT